MKSLIWKTVISAVMIGLLVGLYFVWNPPAKKPGGDGTDQHIPSGSSAKLDGLAALAAKLNAPAADLPPIYDAATVYTDPNKVWTIHVEGWSLQVCPVVPLGYDRYVNSRLQAHVSKTGVVTDLWSLSGVTIITEGFRILPGQGYDKVQFLYCKHVGLLPNDWATLAMRIGNHKDS